jgi:hypothetical protein
MARGIPNPFKVGERIYNAESRGKLLPYVCQEIALRGWSGNTRITKKVSKRLYEKHQANLKMLAEHGA